MRVNKSPLIDLILRHTHALILTNKIAANASKLQWTQIPSKKLKRQTGIMNNRDQGDIRQRIGPRQTGGFVPPTRQRTMDCRPILGYGPAHSGPIKNARQARIVNILVKPQLQPTGTHGRRRNRLGN